VTDACEIGCALCRMLSLTRAGLVVLDGRQQCSFINPAGERLLGTSASSAVGRPGAELSGPFGEAIRAGLSAMSQTDQPWWEQLVRRDGQPVVVHLARIEPGPTGEDAGTVVWIQPQSEQQQFLRHARQAEKMVALGELAAAVAHEINSPLSGILECMRIVEGSEDRASTFAQFGGLMQRGLEQIHRTVERILSFSATPAIGRKRVALDEVVSNVAELMQLRARAEGVDLRIGGLRRCELVLDADGIGQVLMNLINNAIDAVQNQPTRQVTVGMSEGTDEEVGVYVEDSGPGIEPHLIERIFDPFFTSKPTGQGTGLGLSVSANIVHAHGGRIVVSDRRGGGAIFEVKLPRRLAAGKKSGSPRRQPPQAGS